MARKVRRRPNNPRKVFLNIPYDEAYGAELFPAIVTVCWGFGLRPFLLKNDLNRPRLVRLLSHIRSSDLMITDLSRPDRMNMPLEAGIALAYGRPCAFLVDNEPLRKRHISDLQGIDFLEHKGDADRAISLLTNWIRQHPGRTDSRARTCSVSDTSLRFVYRANKAFLADRRNALLDIDAAGRAAKRLYRSWDVDDIATFSDTAGDKTILDSSTLERRHAALQAYAQQMP